MNTKKLLFPVRGRASIRRKSAAAGFKVSHFGFYFPFHVVYTGHLSDSIDLKKKWKLRPPRLLARDPSN